MGVASIACDFFFIEFEILHMMCEQNYKVSQFHHLYYITHERSLRPRAKIFFRAELIRRYRVTRTHRV